MEHPVHTVAAFGITGPYTLRVGFDDRTTQVIDFRPMLAGELFGPLGDVALFNQASIDPELHTLVWPNGADFDPAIRYDWPKHFDGFRALAKEWARARTGRG